MKRVLSVFGDEFFPKFGKGMSTRKRQKAQDKIMEFFKTTKPDLVYIMPTEGTCSFVAVLCGALNIPYIMVSPHPSFYDQVKINDKVCIRQAMEGAKSFVLLDDDVPDTREESVARYDASVEFLCKVSSAIVFFYSKETSREYKSFMDNTCAKVPEKYLWELVYDIPNAIVF